MPAPANDLFANAIALSTTLPSTLAGQTTVDATFESGEPTTFGGDEHRGVWYTFTPTVTQRYKISCDVSGTAVWTDNRMSYIALFTGSAVNALTLVKRQNNDTNSNANAIKDGDRLAIEADLTAGTTYRIRVGWRWFTGEGANAHSFNFGINVEAMGTPSAPANDNLANATNLGTDPADGNYAGTLRGATDDVGAFNWGGGVETAWIKFVAGATGTKEMHLVNPNYTPGNTYADDDSLPYAEIYRVTGTNPPAAFSDLTYVNDFDMAVSPWVNEEWITSKSVSLIAGATYYVIVYPWHFNSGLTFDYELVFGAYVAASAPDNDDVLGVTLGNNEFDMGLSDWDSSATDREAAFRAGTTELATAQAGEPSKAGFAATRSVWYHMRLPTGDQYKVWVESAVDCVLGVFDKDGNSGEWHGVTFGPTTLLFSDDDSGPGDQPELFITPPGGLGKSYWVAVDSKTEGEFTLHFERVKVGTPVANDDFADAQLISSFPAVIAGTTVGSWAESRETDAEWFGIGPIATVWYKFVAPRDGVFELTGTSTADGDGYVYADVFKGNVATPDLLTRIAPDLSGSQGSFSFFDTLQERKENAWLIPVVNGETYYIRVQTETHSEDFTLWLDEQYVYIDIQPSGLDVGPYADSFEVYVNVEASGTEDFHDPTTEDTATVYIDIVPSAPWETHGHEWVDTATVYMDIRNTGGECFSTHMGGSMDMECDKRWTMTCDTRWSLEADPRWTVEEIDGQGVHC